MKRPAPPKSIAKMSTQRLATKAWSESGTKGIVCVFFVFAFDVAFLGARRIVRVRAISLLKSLILGFEPGGFIYV